MKQVEEPRPAKKQSESRATWVMVEYSSNSSNSKITEGSYEFTWLLISSIESGRRGENIRRSPAETRDRAATLTRDKQQHSIYLCRTAVSEQITDWVGTSTKSTLEQVLFNFMTGLGDERKETNNASKCRQNALICIPSPEVWSCNPVQAFADQP